MESLVLKITKARELIRLEESHLSKEFEENYKRVL